MWLGSGFVRRLVLLVSITILGLSLSHLIYQYVRLVEAYVMVALLF